MAYTPISRTIQSYIKSIRVLSKKAGRFGIGVFSVARFGSGDGYSPIAKPTLTQDGGSQANYSQVSRPTP